MINKTSFRLASLVAVVAIIGSFIMSFRYHDSTKKAEATHTAPTVTDYQAAVWMVKAVEGYSPCPYPDGRQTSVGYGTKGTKCLTVEQASARFRSEFQKRYDVISRDYPDLTRRQKLAMTSFIYNVGSIGPRLHGALLMGDTYHISEVMREYIMFEGKPNEGLKKRRELEISLFLLPDDQLDSFALAMQRIVISDVTARN